MECKQKQQKQQKHLYFMNTSMKIRRHVSFVVAFICIAVYLIIVQRLHSLFKVRQEVFVMSNDEKAKNRMESFQKPARAVGKLKDILPSSDMKKWSRNWDGMPIVVEEYKLIFFTQPKVGRQVDTFLFQSNSYYLLIFKVIGFTDCMHSI
jgi:hypothetical protein